MEKCDSILQARKQAQNEHNALPYIKTKFKRNVDQMQKLIYSFIEFIHLIIFNQVRKGTNVVLSISTLL